MTTELKLPLGKTYLRVVIIDGAVWFAAKDLYSSQRSETNKKHLACFDRKHLQLHTFVEDGIPLRLTLISTLGALTAARGFRPPADRIMDAWVRKQVQLLGFERPPLTIAADGGLPVKPKASLLDARDEWDRLRAANPEARRNAPVEALPELDDDDIPPPPIVPSQERIDADLEAMIDAQYEIVALPRRSAKPKRKKR